MYLGWFRVGKEEELKGLDVTHHGGSAYNIADKLTDDSPWTTDKVSDDDSGDASPTTEA
jgi:hypothetical protein